MLRHLPRLARGLDHALSADRLARGDLALLAPYQPSLSCAWLFQRAMSVRVGQLAAPPPAAPAPAAPAERKAGLPNPAAALAAAVGTAFAAALAAARAALALLASPFSRRAGAAPAEGPWLKMPPGHINSLLACNFGVMKALGPWALKPFLQDTIRLTPLSLTMGGMMLASPLVVTRVLAQVTPGVLLGWFAHFFALAAYAATNLAAGPLRRALGREGTRGGYVLRR
jgi:hypothetical protein